MSERIEEMLREYPSKKRYLKCLENQLRNFYGISDTEMIDSMCFYQPEGERVQTSGVANKTASIALSYREKMEEINRDWYRHLRKQYEALSEEIRLFESALDSLSGRLPDIMRDMVVNDYTWDYICNHYHISRTTLGKYRRKAIQELEVLYEKQDVEMIDYLLS